MKNQKNMKSSEYIILGRGRSGTSVASSLLHHMGIHMGDNLKEASRVNVWGYYEDLDFLNFNLDKIHSAGVTFRNFDLDKLDNSGAKELIEKKRQKGKWGWKAGRAIFTIRMFLPYLNDPHFIVTNRNIEDHVKSSTRVHGGSEAKNLYDILKYYEEVENFFDEYDYPRFDISFDRLKDHKTKEKEIKALAKFAGVDLDKKTFNKLKTIVK